MLTVEYFKWEEPFSLCWKIKSSVIYILFLFCFPLCNQHLFPSIGSSIPLFLPQKQLHYQLLAWLIPCFYLIWFFHCFISQILNVLQGGKQLRFSFSFFKKRKVKSFFFFLHHLSKQKNSTIFLSSCLFLQISQVFLQLNVWL